MEYIYIGRQLVCNLNPLHLDRFQAARQLGKDERLCGKRVLLFYERKYMARESCATSLNVSGCTISIHAQIDALHASSSHSSFFFIRKTFFLSSYFDD